jgi:hypothetical protein
MSALAGCQGKKRYATWAEAERAARWQRRRHSLVFVPYHCTHCHGVHTAEESLGRKDQATHDRYRRDAR